MHKQDKHFWCKSLQTALDNAHSGDGIALLSNGYPSTPTTISTEEFEQLWIMRIKLYIEFPEWLPRMNVGNPFLVDYFERIVVNNNSLINLPLLSILITPGTSNFSLFNDE